MDFMPRKEVRLNIYTCRVRAQQRCHFIVYFYYFFVDSSVVILDACLSLQTEVLFFPNTFAHYYCPFRHFGFSNLIIVFN